QTCALPILTRPSLEQSPSAGRARSRRYLLETRAAGLLKTRSKSRAVSNLWFRLYRWSTRALLARHPGWSGARTSRAASGRETDTALGTTTGQNLATFLGGHAGTAAVGTR